jgi:mannose-1-phosphate guanylyltransferase
MDIFLGDLSRTSLKNHNLFYNEKAGGYMIKALVLAGGQGKRLWPKSTSDLPKQFTTLFHGKSLFQYTMERLLSFLSIQDIYVVTLEKYKGIVKDQVSIISDDHIIVEPYGRDTAACIGLSATYLKHKYGDPILITIPADQYVLESGKYKDALYEAANQAIIEDCVVTLGIKPHRPETGYGYIKRGEKLGSFYKVDQFIEKPPLNQAKEYFNVPTYYWNSGIFVWRASTVLQMIEQFMPFLSHGLKRIEKSMNTPDEKVAIEREYVNIEKKSIDYGVIEQTDSIYVIPVDFIWDDLGSWDSLERIFSTDEKGNVVEGKSLLMDTTNCVINSSGQLIASIGIKDLVIVATEKAILVCPKNRAQDVKLLLEQNDLE